jgi:hypothetical protein
MRLRRKAALAFASLAVLGATATAAATTAQAATVTSVCVGSGGGGLCFNDWNGASSGPVKMFAHGVANDSFRVEVLGGYCNNGRVDANPACPYWNGSGWNSQLEGGSIVQIRSTVTNRCIGTDTAGNLNIGPCPPTSGGGGSNIWVTYIIPGCTASGDLALSSVYWVNHNHDAVPNNDVVYALGGSGSQPFVGGGGSNSATCFRYANQ